MKSFGRVSLIILCLYLAFIFVADVYDTRRPLPKFDELNFHTGVIKHVGGEFKTKKRRYIPVILEQDGGETHIKQGSFLTQKYLRSKIGSLATIGTWDDRERFFEIRTETWHVIIDDVIVYDYKARYARATETNTNFFVIYIACALLFMALCVVRHIKMKNKKTDLQL